MTQSTDGITDVLVAITRFTEILEKEGTDAAVAWAEKETQRIEGRTGPQLKVVSSKDD